MTITAPFPYKKQKPSSDSASHKTPFQTMVTLQFVKDFVKDLFSTTTESALLKFEPGFNDHNDEQINETDPERLALMTAHAEVHKRIKNYTENSEITATYQEGSTSFRIMYDGEYTQYLAYNDTTCSDFSLF